MIRKFIALLALALFATLALVASPAQAVTYFTVNAKGVCTSSQGIATFTVKNVTAEARQVTFLYETYSPTQGATGERGTLGFAPGQTRTLGTSFPQNGIARLTIWRGPQADPDRLIRRQEFWCNSSYSPRPQGSLDRRLP